jgi:hypothetical protein
MKFDHNGTRTMGLNLSELLIHSEAVPRRARDALRAASFAPPEQRKAVLESAARILLRETDLDWRDTRDLLGLPQGSRAEFCSSCAPC